MAISADWFSCDVGTVIVVVRTAVGPEHWRDVRPHRFLVFVAPPCTMFVGNPPVVLPQVCFPLLHSTVESIVDEHDAEPIAPCRKPVLSPRLELLFGEVIQSSNVSSRGGLHHLTVLMLLVSKVIAPGSCTSRGPQQAHPLTQHASGGPHLDFLCCHRLPVEHPCFRLVVAEILSEDGCRCRARRASAYHDFCSVCHQFGHMCLTRVPACACWAMSDSRS